MASFQAHAINLVIRWRIKRRLNRLADASGARAVFNAGPIMPAPRRLDVGPDTVGGVPGERVALPGAEAGPTLMYLHGGGYLACSPQTHRPITTAFARHGFRVFAPDYRLAPEHRFPAALDDAVSAYRGLLAAGTPPQRLVIAGDSAGGGLALAAMLALRDAGAPLPAAAALFSPWTDLAATGATLKTNDRLDAMFSGAGVGEIARAYLGDAGARTPLASPLYADLRGLPPLLVHVGEREVLRDDSTRLAERARAAGVDVELTIWPVVPHCWQLFHLVMPEGRRSLAIAADFLHRRCGAGG